MENRNTLLGIGVLGIIGGIAIISTTISKEWDKKDKKDRKCNQLLSFPSHETIKCMIGIEDIACECRTSCDIDKQWIRDKHRMRYSGFCGDSKTIQFPNQGTIGCTKSQFHVDETMEWAIPYITQTMGNLLWMKLSSGIKLELAKQGCDLKSSVFSNKSIQHYIQYIDESSLVSHYYFSIYELNDCAMVIGEPLYNVEFDICIDRDDAQPGGVTCSWA